MIVTTCARPTEVQVSRARHVADRCQVPFVPRTGALPPGLAYVVGREREELRRGTERLAVHAGLLHARTQTGHRHPLIAALTDGQPVDSVVDGTLGLAADALHIAAVLDCPVVGIEGSAPIACLLQEGLARLSVELPAARRIRLQPGDAAEQLEQMPRDSADVVYLSPMYPSPRKAAPGFELLRELAIDAPLDLRLLQAADRVARQRVVVKVAPGDVLPVGREVGRARGRAVDYVVVRP